MPKLYSSDFIIKIFLSQGFFLTSQKGSHIKFRKKDGEKVLTVIVPAAKEKYQLALFILSLNSQT